MGSQSNLMIAVDQVAFQQLVDKVDQLARAINAVHMTPRSPWLSLAEYSARVGKSQKTVRNWIKDGKIESRREGTKLMIKAA